MLPPPLLPSLYLLFVICIFDGVLLLDLPRACLLLLPFLGDLDDVFIPEAELDMLLFIRAPACVVLTEKLLGGLLLLLPVFTLEFILSWLDYLLETACGVEICFMRLTDGCKFFA